MTGLFAPTGADAEVRRRIALRGPLTFAEFMEIALYWPDGGYYASRRSFGPLGDFYTAPLAHPVFGALVARQLLTLWRALGSPAPFNVMEAGAGDGTLALDVVAQASELGRSFADALAYTAVDLREPPAEYPGHWVRSGGVPAPGGSGVVLANELLDAMPVHRVVKEGGQLRELFVDAAPEGGFVEIADEPSSPALGERLDGLGAALSEGYRTEICLASEAWTAQAFAAIERGYLLLIDYGHEASVFYDESRRAGTLRCYAGHTLGMNPYFNVGRQDISAHVEFTSVRSAAIAAGFEVAGEMSQSDWLRSLGIEAYRAEVAERSGLNRMERMANLRGMDVLLDDEGMGSFRVLAFARDAPTDGVLGASPWESAPAPLAGVRHMPFGTAPPG
ncbi:MAG: SAM-dependent methyltransferase [Chloroflexota bacterium]|nr:SAM-dependent methyltransferase [Chloroflexota bacterium]MDE2885851.1 SAM-dependent methyltransferase [Chloroflexota bacterium]